MFIYICFIYRYSNRTYENLKRMWNDKTMKCWFFESMQSCTLISYTMTRPIMCLSYTHTYTYPLLNLSSVCFMREKYSHIIKHKHVALVPWLHVFSNIITHYYQHYFIPAGLSSIENPSYQKRKYDADRQRHPCSRAEPKCGRQRSYP